MYIRKQSVITVYKSLSVLSEMKNNLPELNNVL